MEKIGGNIRYQWYRSGTPKWKDATKIPGANKLIYIPEIADQEGFLFLKMTMEYIDAVIPPVLLNYVMTEKLETERVFVSPALGPVLPAFFIESDLKNISVFDNEGNELLQNFDNEIKNYSIEVGANVTSVRVYPTWVSSNNNYVVINGVPSELWDAQAGGLNIPLKFGNNKIIVVSTAESFAGVNTFSISVDRKVKGEEDVKLLPPQARFVKIDNSFDEFLGKTLHGSYTFYDELDRAEKGTKFQWYRQNDEEGDGRVAIVGATETTYKLSENDIGKYVYFEVIPKAEGSIAGEATMSCWIGPINRIDSKLSNITDIKVVYEGKNILNNFDEISKTYMVNFTSKEGKEIVEISVVGGEGITINGTTGHTKRVNFYGTHLVEIQANVPNSSETTSYFIQFNDEAKPASIEIKGMREVNITGEHGKIVSLEALVYDQYNQLIEGDIEWTVPSGYDFEVVGFNNQILNLHFPSNVAAKTIEIRANIFGDESVSYRKNILITN